ncbi:hypothetical protein QYE76_036829 [Lolium multiflorum]|uniref:NB-ARC domain-containing protein n=1 Tax=Lolium multiflorum TaxID=4521 RepID=A0AAD8R2J4_LOLMU|nr:disease resistance protein RGA5-like [Lolium perenne]KAK1613156.1 hypothetical protein QYE76_036829 [Lolium multiflorum]
MESLPMVCYSAETMNTLIDKVAKMENYSNATEEFSDLAQEFKKAVLSLKEDFFHNLALPKVCMKQVRELVFEIEDWIDQKPVTNMLVPSDMEDIRNFMTEIKEARERFTWYYDLLKVVPTEPDVAGVATSQTSNINIDINSWLLVEEKPCHGLLDGPRDELIQHLTDGKDEMRKVVSIVGMEGLGKTTLAKQIYSKLLLRRQFECQAFVYVGRRTSMTMILKDILRQLNPVSKKWQHWRVVDVQEIITELWEYLCTKRYFILVDGIWSTWAWNVINCVLPNNRGSRVLTTTCITDVGMYCSSYPNDLVYHMEALSKEKSKILFLSKTLNLQDEEKWAGFEEHSCYMLKLADGMPLAMPLAITVAAGLLLARKSEAPAELKMLGESIISSLKQYSPCEGMNKILQMSYADLSLPLRSCIMYLSVFPENYTIQKDRLILLWDAEGIIVRIDKEFSLVTGERYFNELISRRLIQPVFHLSCHQAVGCTVHTLILDFIRSLSREENFAMTAAELICVPFPCDTIRRFSLDCHNEDEVDTLSTSSVNLSRMRSLTVFRDAERKVGPPYSQRLPWVYAHGEEMRPTKALEVPINSILAFKLLRVLDLGDTKNLEKHHLEGIGGLVLLRYLGLAGTSIYVLPEDIGKLEQLETLDLRGHIGLVTFPASAVKLRKLRHLLVEVDATNIWEMPKLERAPFINVESSSSLGNVVELLRKSEQIRTLGVSMRTSVPTETDLVSFLDEVVKSKVQFLDLDYGYQGSEAIPILVDSWEKVTAPLETKFEPRRFSLTIYYSNGSRITPNMGSLASLTELDIYLYEANAEDFIVLEGLTNLVLLTFLAMDCSVIGRFIIKGGIFPFLKVFSFRVKNSWMGLQFEKGAMPQLQRLGRGFHVIKRRGQAYPDIGIEHLTRLTQVHAITFCEEATVSEVEAAEAAIRYKVSEIATKPTLELSRENQDEMWTVEQQQPTLVNQLSEETSIGQFEDDDQIREHEEQVSGMDGKSTQEWRIEHEDPMRKDKRIYYTPSKKQLFENVQKRKLRRIISSLSDKMKDAGRKLIGHPKLRRIISSLSDNSSKFKLESSTEEEHQMRKGKGK